MPNILKEITLLLVEDEALLRRATVDFLSGYCGRVVFAGNGSEALEVFAREKPDLVLTDIIMPEMDGIALTERLHELSPETPVVFFSAFSDVPYLLRGIELGVAGFIPKPAADTQLLAVLEKAALPVLQRKQLTGLERELLHSVELRLGKSPRMKEIAAQVTRLARTDYSLLIQGETGTGKSRLAALIHDLSPRAEKPFVSVQLSTLPESLVASNLFGHEKGAFTGAEQKREGLVAAARGGTLFIDDIDAASPMVQALLLQLVDEKSFTPLGSNRQQKAEVRIIAASNSDLATASATGQFRQDLYYRLAGLVIELPPLRTISEEIPQLATTFLREVAQGLHCKAPLITAEAMALLRAHPWPGNIRELQNVLKRATILVTDEIDAGLIHDTLGHAENGNGASAASPAPANPAAEALPLTMAAVEEWALKRALAAAEGKKMLAARLLDLNYYTFRRRLARYGLDGGED
ncbi:MAG: hypothetical protein A2091_03575 [Desulfuromonadales bacterium GWD2_61_12]|nr:MAG: hypothetical protein A2091_03575 [Desulfuromonadales bacterium GWD2_61_12]OGR33514.1 MAG: hypothetical protein A2005_08105 [Desulfuromonadales bacterium GWC2_61_20]HAD03229.1 hypothetical protein [Desulfuromonas sp.]HBT83106.1 hypothetical protein [Desulfuromonas sp.]